MTITRRSFLAGGAAATAVSMATPFPALAGDGKALSDTPSKTNKWPGRCVVDYDGEATEGLEGREEVIKRMVDESIMALTGEKAVGAAWQAVFPADFTIAKKVALKINMLNPKLPPHPLVVKAVIGGLTQISVGNAAFPVANIVVFDGNNRYSFAEAGFSTGILKGAASVFGKKGDAGYYRRFGDGALNDRAYAATLNECDYLINIPSMRGHALCGVTLGYKSHYGTYADPGGLHLNVDEALREINCTGPVYRKTVLTVLSGLFGMNIGHGPAGGAGDDFTTYAKTVDPSSSNPDPCTIVMSTDPVTLEYQGIRIMRTNKGQGYDLSSMPKFLKASAGVKGSMDRVHAIGVLDEKSMDVRRYINGKSV